MVMCKLVALAFVAGGGFCLTLVWLIHRGGH